MQVILSDDEGDDTDEFEEEERRSCQKKDGKKKSRETSPPPLRPWSKEDKERYLREKPAVNAALICAANAKKKSKESQRGQQVRASSCSCGLL